MNPSVQNRYSGLGTAFLLTDDINGIRSLYGEGQVDLGRTLVDEDATGAGAQVDARDGGLATTGAVVLALVACNHNTTGKGLGC